jgi:hypothetical protein
MERAERRDARGADEVGEGLFGSFVHDVIIKRAKGYNESNHNNR